MIRQRDDVIGSLIHDVACLLRLCIDDGTAATGKLVDRLVEHGLRVERGLVRRHDDPGDRCANLRTVTAGPRDLLVRLKPDGKRIREDVLQNLSEPERQRLQRSFRKLKSRRTESRTEAA